MKTAVTHTNESGPAAVYGTLLLLHALGQLVLGVFAMLQFAGVDTLAPARGWRAFIGAQTGMTIAVLGATLFKFTWWSRLNNAVPTFVWATTVHAVTMTIATIAVMTTVEEGHSTGLIPDGGVWFDGEPDSVWAASSIASLWYTAMLIIVLVTASVLRHFTVTARAMIRAARSGKSNAGHYKGPWGTADPPLRAKGSDVETGDRNPARLGFRSTGRDRRPPSRR